MRPYGRISTHMPFGFEVRGGISDERLVSVDAKLKCGRGWAWGQFPAYVCWRSGVRRFTEAGQSIAKTRSADYPKIVAGGICLIPRTGGFLSHYEGIFEPRDGEL